MKLHQNEIEDTAKRVIEVKELYRPIHLQNKQAEVVQIPRSVDTIFKKKDILYRDPESVQLHSSQSKQEVSA